MPIKIDNATPEIIQDNIGNILVDSSTVDFTYDDANNTITADVIVGGGSGVGDVEGPASSTDNAIARFDGTSGKTLQNSGVIIDDSDSITGVNNLIVNGYITAKLDIGDPGTESAGPNINGTIIDAGLQINDIGISPPVATIGLLKHSTTQSPSIATARSRTDDATFASVVNGDDLLNITTAGWTGNHYDSFAEISFRVSPTGTISTTSSPGQIALRTTPDGSEDVQDVLRVDEDRSTRCLGDLIIDAELNHDGSTLGFFNTSPASQTAAYTQTFSNSSRTHNASVAVTLTNSVSGTTDDTVQALTDPADAPTDADALRDDLVTNLIPELRNNFAELTEQYNNLQGDLENTRQVLTQVIDDLQLYGLLQ